MVVKQCSGTRPEVRNLRQLLIPTILAPRIVAAIVLTRAGLHYTAHACALKPNARATICAAIQAVSLGTTLKRERHDRQDGV